MPDLRVGDPAVLKLPAGVSRAAVEGARSGSAVQRHRIALLAVLATARACAALHSGRESGNQH
jgi:hypothetical protein